ncbi:MAG TPA: SCO family protein [Verrucomicrobiae bacterium]|nr:SCO family protein [Verrucomicrobiae bacterium]
MSVRRPNMSLAGTARCVRAAADLAMPRLERRSGSFRSVRWTRTGTSQRDVPTKRDRRAMRPGVAVMLALVLLCCHSVPAQPISDAALARIDFTQNLDAQLPLDLRFVDETGKSVQLAQYFGSKPVILVLGYYGCPMLCTLVLNGLVESLQDMRWRAGDQFTVVNVSINPAEQPALAAAKKQTYLKRYGRSGAAEGWHFLTGREPEIRQLTKTVGFAYQYDPATRQYAHPSGLVVLTPQGKVSGYLFGVTFSSKELYQALHQASSSQIGSPIQRLVLLCFHYNPLTGKYSPTIVGLLRVCGVATVLGIACLVLVSVRRTKPS